MAEFDYTKVGRPDAMEPFSLTDLFASITDMEDEYAAFVGCFYGDPGTRKTTTAMKLAQKITPMDKKILYVYTGQGWSSLKNHKSENLMARTKKMPFIRYEQIEALQAVLRNPAMRKQMNIGTIVFDEYNRMQDMDIDTLTKHRAELVAQSKERDKKGNLVYKDPDTPEWPEYNTTKVRMINLMNDILSLDDINVIFLCHTRLQKKTGKIEPDFPNATASAFISMVHSIYYTGKEDVVVNGKIETRFPIELVSGEETVSKNRIGGLPAKVYDVNLVADAFLEWNADVMEKRNAAKQNDIEGPTAGEVISVEAVEQPAVEKVEIEAPKVDVVIEPVSDNIETPKASTFTPPTSDEDELFNSLFA
jgi:hypothetical protein